MGTSPERCCDFCGSYRRAIDYLQANFPSDDNFAQLTRFYAGLAMGALGFPAQARAEVEEALRLQPISPLVLPAQRFGEELKRAAARERGFSGELRFGLFYAHIGEKAGIREVSLRPLASFNPPMLR